MLNTSLNENDPMAMSPAHAVETFVNAHIDLLVLGSHIVRRRGS